MSGSEIGRNWVSTPRVESHDGLRFFGWVFGA
jgi:hypothetical protein